MVTWEHVKTDGDTKHHDSLYRAKVPGGWLIKICSGDDDKPGVSITFCPDEHYV